MRVLAVATIVLALGKPTRGESQITWRDRLFVERSIIDITVDSSGQANGDRSELKYVTWLDDIQAQLNHFREFDWINSPHGCASGARDVLDALRRAHRVTPVPPRLGPFHDVIAAKLTAYGRLGSAVCAAVESTQLSTDRPMAAANAGAAWWRSEVGKLNTMTRLALAEVAQSGPTRRTWFGQAPDAPRLPNFPFGGHDSSPPVRVSAGVSYEPSLIPVTISVSTSGGLDVTVRGSRLTPIGRFGAFLRIAVQHKRTLVIVVHGEKQTFVLGEGEFRIDSDLAGTRYRLLSVSQDGDGNLTVVVE